MGGQLKVVVYALGGGLGHAVRGAALAASLVRRGHDAVVLLPDDRTWVAEALGARSLPLARTTDAEALRVRVARAVGSDGHLIVDAHPTGVLRELSPERGRLGARRSLVLRLHQALPRDALPGYDAVFDVEPNLAWRDAFAAVACGPVVRIGGAPRQAPRPDVLIVASDAALTRFASRLSSRLAARGARVQVWGAADRGHELLDLGALAPRVVVGAAGYNLSYEAAALGIVHLAIPRPRPFDDQARRARAVAIVCDGPEALERRALAALAGDETRPALAIESHDAFARRFD